MSLIELMSNDLNISIKFIRLVSKRSIHYYRHYRIPKARGGTREIFHPSPVLKTFQYWIIENIFNVLPISEHATAYEKGSSIKNNALVHLDNGHILRTDIEEFFGSIDCRHITELLRRNEIIINKKLGIVIDAADLELILAFILRDNHLTIGSVSSPRVSNTVMYLVDKDLVDIAEKYDCIFTRYADDMIFSSKNHIDREIINEIEIAVNKIDLKLNRSKTYFMSAKNKKMITGVILNSGRLTIGRKKVDKIKKIIYDYCVHGIGNVNVIKGYLSFLKDVDPFRYGRLIIKYQRYGDINNLLIGKNLMEVRSSFEQVAATEEID